MYQFTGIKKIDDYFAGKKPNGLRRAGSYRIYLGIMQKYIQTKSYNLVDIGAGDGTFLDIAKPFVRGVFAFEASQTAAGILAEKGYLSNTPIINLSPKIVTAWQVIEHVNDPRLFINDLHINESDWLVITSPAPDSATARRLHPTGYWRSLSPSHHLCLFSLRGLKSVACDCGLTVVHYEHTWSACHGAIDNARTNVLDLVKWPIKKMLGRKPLPPYFYGKNSFIAILRRPH